MKTKKNILILLSVQFGYHTDTYMYCKYLDRTKYNISYFCFDMGLPRSALPETNIVYVSLHKNKIWRYLVFIKEFTEFTNKNRFDLIFHVHTKYTFLIRLFNLFKPTVLDIRTGDINDNPFLRWIKNQGLNLCSLLYKNVSVISESLSEKFSFIRGRAFILPLGGEDHGFPPKDFNELKLLYAGTLDNRNIHHTVVGLSMFVERYPEESVTYDILGTGSRESLKLLTEVVMTKKLDGIVTLHGRKNHSELARYFSLCNIGIVYVPQKRYYDCQPSTKLFESLLAGMPVIATNTYENRSSLKQGCGLITEDNPESFCLSLERLINMRTGFNSQRIKEEYIVYSWQNIVANKLEKYIDFLCER